MYIYNRCFPLPFVGKALCDGTSGDYGVPSPGPAFKEVWQVKVWPKGLGQAKNLVGIYRLCLTEKTVNFVKLNSDAAAVVLQLMNVRRCGHSENFFFVEVGRSAVTGPGEFWMQVEDSVVAQNMHETLLEAMKALSEEFRQRSKSQSTTAGGGGGATASNPISVPSRRHHPNPPPSQVGFIRRPRTEPPATTGGGGGGTSNNASPTPRHGFSRACNSSDGAKVEEGMNAGTKGVNSSSSPTTNGSCSSTPILRSTSVHAPTPVKAQHALMRSISSPAPSSAQNLSSYSGNGSEFVGTGPGTTAAGGDGNGSTCKRVPLRQPSVSGSFSDYGSSDEYGSSPGEQSLLTATIQADSVDSSGGDEAANYIIMAQKGASNSLPTDNSVPQTRRVLRRSSGRECDTEHRTISKRASLPPMALERLGTYRRAGDVEIEEDNYAVMSRSTSRESFSSRQESESTVGGTRYLDVAAESKAEPGSCGLDGSTITGNGIVGSDNGYMSMLPGVTAPPVSLSHSLSVAVPDSKPADDYMAMTPNNTISLPQQIHLPTSTTDGYMMMSPNSSCSPDQRVVSGAWIGKNSADNRPGSDYMNMSPISVRANSTPSPQESLTASEKHPQQPPPKMVYSYYSLPRSYKHSSPKHFEDGLGRGKCLNSERGNGGGQGLGTCRGTSHYQEPGVGQHLSFSSSSYSSSSASSESLGEGEEKLTQVRKTAAGAQTKDNGALQQRLGSGAAKQAQGQRNRPLSLFVDISKANTLPRVRETPVPPEPKSPGEYVSIEFKSERSIREIVRGPKKGGSIPATSQHPLSRPTSCVAGFLPHLCSPSSDVPPSVASEYVNMELGASPSPSSFSLTPLGFPSFTTPTTPPTTAPKAWDEQRSTPQNEEEAEVEMVHSGHRPLSASQSLESPIPCAEYTEMVFGLSSDTTTSSMTSKESLLDRQESIDPTLSLGLNLEFPMSKAPNPDHGAKVIKADPQARRRHCSETFLAPSSLSSCPVNSPSSMCMISEHTQAIARRLGLDGTLTGSGNLQDNPNQHANHGSANINTTQTSSTEQGLNYIDLDLATRESSHLVDVQTAGQTARLFSSVLDSGATGGAGGTGGLSSSASNLNTYASIDFYKSEELRSHQGSSSSKDSTGKSSFVLIITFQISLKDNRHNVISDELKINKSIFKNDKRNKFE